MHRTIGAVFKALGVSILLMILMDITFNVVDTVTVNNRITTLSTVMQDELSRHNSIPDDIAVLFKNQINDVVTNSNVATDIRWNIDESITVKGKTYPPINELNVQDYGKELTLVIVVRMQPNSLVFYRDPSQNSGGFLGKNIFQYDQVFTYKVPALRYLK